MCRLCDPARPKAPCPSRRDFLKASAIGGAAAATGATLGGSATAQQAAEGSIPAGIGAPGRQTLIRGGTIISVDDSVGNFASGDVLIEGGRIVEIAASIDAPDAAVIDAAGKIVMPGFIDTHHHQFETALRSQLAHGILVNDGRSVNETNYYDTILQTFSMVYRPEDVYINELFAGIAQLDAGVTTVMDVSQIHHSPEHSDAAIEGLQDAGRRSVFGYFEGHGDRSQYPQDARRIREQYFASDDQLTTMVMGGEIYLPGYETSWQIGRELGLPIALHVVGTFGMADTFDQLAQAGEFGDDNIFIHMTGMSDMSWQAAADAGAHVSLAVPIEMHMRHGTPPIQKAIDLGLSTSLSSDVECTMTADPFTQMRGLITLQRMFANEAALSGAEDYPALMQCPDAIRHATIEGARGLKLDDVTGSLTPGKAADIVLLDAEALNVTPLNNAPGAVVTLMERSNVDTVLVAGQVKKWRGQMVGFDIARLRSELEASRDHIFEAAGVERDLFAF
ncbi:Melamine deaminase [Roseivivax jejudonensis]|uniref:Melamine deaminase n=1 Tax=Roseivivax jejudonensis TaxID=1529041 RepID=A0A1X6ZVF8_9RHOB|nr:amidohydrolase family protein [Roseivivax jejudonensis]SLN62785.1 Melamine deaminase [Roseivivax jejudonensis]